MAGMTTGRLERVGRWRDRWEHLIAPQLPEGALLAAKEVTKVGYETILRVYVDFRYDPLQIAFRRVPEGLQYRPCVSSRTASWVKLRSRVHNLLEWRPVPQGSVTCG